jgi:hypothetical protein
MVELPALSAGLEEMSPNQWDGTVFPSIFDNLVIGCLLFRDTGHELPSGAPPVDEPTLSTQEKR